MITLGHESAAGPSIQGDWLASGDSLVRDNRRDVASQHGGIDFPVPLMLSISFLSLCAHPTWLSALTMQL